MIFSTLKENDKLGKGRTKGHQPLFELEMYKTFI
jgi:hypothetical protein